MDADLPSGGYFLMPFNLKEISRKKKFSLPSYVNHNKGQKMQKWSIYTLFVVFTGPQSLLFHF